jgi:hypothetical protein
MERGRASAVDYGTLVGIQGIKEIVADNMVHIGGVARYAFTAGAAKQAVNVALSKVLRCTGL